MHSLLSITVQADGQLLLGGRFTTLQPNGAATATVRNFLARVLADGTLDAGFDPRANANVQSLAVQADGQILVGGEFTALQPNGAVNPTARNQFARLNNEAATQTLSVTSAARIQWLRGGTSPEAQAVTFEVSTDSGVTFTPLGLATRATGGWELTGLSLPASGTIRARARINGGYYNGSSSLLETVALFSATAAAPVITGLSPANQVIILRTNLAAILPVSFTVTAQNATAYQWSVGGLPIAGATAALLSLPDVRRTNGGIYTVTVTGPGGSASTNAALQVIVSQQIRSIQKQADGRMIVRFNDTDGGLPNDLARLEIHSTTNLGPGAVWVTNAGPFTLATGLLQYEDAAVAGIVRRFYRVIER